MTKTGNVLCGVCCAAAILLSAASARPQVSVKKSIPNVQCIIGLENIKPNAKGTLSVQGGALHFDREKEKAEITIPSITDIFTGGESRQDISGLGGTAVKAAVPYGGGRVLSLLSHKVEVLTVEYTDANGGFHGAVFVLPAAHASGVKKLLMDQGAKASIPVQEAADKEKRP